LLLFLVRQQGVSVDEFERVLAERSRLLGVSGVSSDLREVIAAADNGQDRAVLAMDVFVHRLVGAIGSMVASVRSLEALVFTSGIGEHSPLVRARVVDALTFLGLRLDQERNTSADSDIDIARAESMARVLVITSREDLVVLHEMKRLLMPTGE
jgi:acetate kinase